MSHYPTITPHLAITDVAAALEFYGKAFGAQERLRLTLPDGRIAHAEMRVGSPAGSARPAPPAPLSWRECPMSRRSCCVPGRIQDALDRIEAGDTVDWADLALRLGYADQPHFVNSFTALVGVPPGEYSTRPAPS
jgi:AraC-like DNA-binding protein